MSTRKQFDVPLPGFRLSSTQALVDMFAAVRSHSLPGVLMAALHADILMR